MSDASSFYLATLGCKVNQYESRALREAWLERGLAEAADPAEADVILVNSCAVTAKAMADVRATVRRLHRAAPGARIIITGCAAEVPEENLASLPGVTAVTGQAGKAGLLAAPPLLVTPPVEEASSGSSKQAFLTGFPPFSISGYDRSRAVLKIQDGCSHGCAYCIVPLTRGRARSREFDDCLGEAQRLLEAGFREIVISGINLRQYRQDSESGGDFWNFLARLDAALRPHWTGRARFRISSLEPGQLGARALDVLESCHMVAPHLHLSLQSGCSSVLRRMGRGHYDPETVPEFLLNLRRIWPVFGLGADLLTGFPGESDEEFAQGLALCAALPLSYAHVFPYSKRPGTRAANMADQVSREVRKCRAAALREMVLEKKKNFLQSLLNQSKFTVVFENREGEKPGMPLCGVNEYYADCRLRGTETALLREIATVRPVGLDGLTLLVEKADTVKEEE